MSSQLVETTDPAVTVPFAPHAAVGTSVGPYRLLLKLGEGGMGTVFAAEDTRIGRKLALKLMRPELARDERSRKMFLREARTAASICHDRVVRIYEANEADGLPFIALELLTGETLEKHLFRNPVPEMPFVLAVGYQIAEGLHAAHTHPKKLIHRDIKPENVWLKESDGESLVDVRLLDFGLARAAAGDTLSARNVLMVLGTPAYMAPEQWRGEGVDEQSDLFSLGVILYRMATGGRPYPGETPHQIMFHVCTPVAQPADPRTLNPDVPAPLAKLILRLLARDKPQRVKTASEVMATIRPLLPPRTTAMIRLAERQVAVEMRMKSDRPYSLTFSPDGRRVAAGGFHGTARVWDSTTGASVIGLKGHAGRVLAVAFSDDGRRLATGSDDGTARVWDVATGETVGGVRAHPSFVLAAAFSPDARRLATGGHDGIARMWDMDTGAAIAEMRGHAGVVHLVGFGPDGRLLATGGDDGTVWVWDTVTGSAVAVRGKHTAVLRAIGFSPDGKLLATAGDDGTVRVWDVVSGASVSAWRCHKQPIQAVTFSPDGRHLATASYGDNSRVWDAATGRRVTDLTGPQSAATAASYRPDGRRLATGWRDGSVRVTAVGG